MKSEEFTTFAINELACLGIAKRLFRVEEKILHTPAPAFGSRISFARSPIFHYLCTQIAQHRLASPDASPTA